MTNTIPVKLTRRAECTMCGQSHDATTRLLEAEAELANIRAAGALAVMEGARIADEATARLDEYKREVERRDELLHGTDEDLKEARTTAKLSEEARAGLEAVNERLVEALSLKHAGSCRSIFHPNYSGFGPCNCGTGDALAAAASPSQALAERESALKARIEALHEALKVAEPLVGSWVATFAYRADARANERPRAALETVRKALKETP